jgi:hypothetical protein
MQISCCLQPDKPSPEETKMPEVRIGALPLKFPIDKRRRSRDVRDDHPEKGARRPHKAGSLLRENPA